MNRCIMSTVSVPVEIPSDRNQVERSKRSTDITERRGREVIPSSGSNVADLLDADNVQKRKRFGNGKREKMYPDFF